MSLDGLVIERAVSDHVLGLVMQPMAHLASQRPRNRKGVDAVAGLRRFRQIRRELSVKFEKFVWCHALAPLRLPFVSRSSSLLRTRTDDRSREPRGRRPSNDPPVWTCRWIEPDFG